MGIRVRWSAAAKIGAAIVAALLALQTLPALLRPPHPAPLPPDVGPLGVHAPQPKPLADRAQREKPGPRPAPMREPRRPHPAPPREPRRPRPDLPGQGRLGRVVSGGAVRRSAKSSEGETSRHTPT